MGRKKHRILNHNLLDQRDDHGTIKAAVERILSTYPHTVFPYYVATADGELVRLVYAGAAWKSGESND